jgi:AraC-like DNA-binding protein
LTQFVNEYRLEHAKRLLLEHPEMKISSVAIESGFTNDKAMTRYFKEHTGMTPTEWKATLQNNT